MAADVDAHALAERGRVHGDVEQLRAEIADHGKMNLRFQLRERLAGSLRCGGSGCGEAFVELHQFLLPRSLPKRLFRPWLVGPVPLLLAAAFSRAPGT